MFHKNVLFLIAISFLSGIYSCASSQKMDATKSKDVTIISATYSPVIRGANAPKGRRIEITLVTKTDLVMDSIHYATQMEPVELVHISQDTIWVEAYFYPNPNLENRTEGINFTSNDCELYFTKNKNAKSIFIKNMALKKSDIQWR